MSSPKQNSKQNSSKTKELPESDIDYLVDLWHQSELQVPLHEFLNMTWEEYSLWVNNTKSKGQ